MVKTGQYNLKKVKKHGHSKQENTILTQTDRELPLDFC